MAKVREMDSIHITLGFILKGFIAREIYFVLLCIFLLLCILYVSLCIFLLLCVILYVQGNLYPIYFFAKTNFAEIVGVSPSSFLFKFYKSTLLPP